MKKLKQAQHSLSQNVKYRDLIKEKSWLNFKERFYLLAIILNHHEALIFLIGEIIKACLKVLN